ncbi:MAG: carbohydrate ABC transporter permease [Candidatus Bipolaricaulia bacterium]
MFDKMRSTTLAYLLVMPALGLILIFTLYPFGRALWTSFHRINPILPGSPFVGFSNYISVFSSFYFTKSLINTLILIGFAVPIITGLSIAISRLLIEEFYGRGVLRPAVLIPWVIPSAITGLIWQWMFNGSYGAINAVLNKLGLISNYIPWLTEPITAKFAVMVAFVWAQLPFPIILMMAALTSIFRSVIVIIYETLTAFTSYSIPYAMTGGGPGTATSMLSYYIWSLSFDQLKFGEGAALAAIIAGLSLIFIFAIINAIPSQVMLEEEEG